MYLKRIAIATILAAFIFGAVYGLAATMTVATPPYLGAGSADVTTPNVTAVEWVLVNGDPTHVDKVVLTLSTPISGGGKIYIRLDGSTWLGPFTTVSGATQILDLSPDVAVADIVECYVVINSP